MQLWWHDADRGDRNTRTKLTWNDVGSNPGLRDDGPAATRFNKRVAKCRTQEAEIN